MLVLVLTCVIRVFRTSVAVYTFLSQRTDMEEFRNVIVLGASAGGIFPPEAEIPVELEIIADITDKLMSDINQLKKIADLSDI